MSTAVPARVRLFEALAMALVAVLSLSLLGYVAVGEAERIYPTFHTAKLAAQGEALTLSLQAYLASGLPLRDFPGFKRLTDPVLAAGSDIEAAALFDPAGKQLFHAGSGDPLFIDPVDRGSQAATATVVRQNAERYQVVAPLHNRFGAIAGRLTLDLPKRAIQAHIRAVMAPIPWFIGAGVIALALLAFVNGGRRPLWNKLGDAAVYSLMTVVVSVMLVHLYVDGAGLKARSLAETLGQRLGAVARLGVDLSDLAGVGQILADYDRLYPEIGVFAVVEGGIARFHSDPSLVGRAWAPPPGDWEYSEALPSEPGQPERDVRVTLPASTVWITVASSVKNFLVLFFASTFIATVSFQLAGALRRLMIDGWAWRDDPDFAVDAVKPILFIGFFVENLGVSFLPQLMQRSASAAGLSPTAASLMFMTYFLCFAASLIPAGLLAARYGAKPMICAGALLAMAGLGLLAWSDQAGIVIAGRIAAGFGQGMLFIGAQSFILARTDATRRTRGAGVIVYAFNGGMICGMALGSLLVTYVGERGVFGIAVAITLLGTAFALAALPATTPEPARAAARRARGGSVWTFLRGLLSADFVSAVVLVGVPTKAVLTGVVVFAMPLVLSSMRLPQEDIGQVMMFYALGVLIASRYATRLADSLGATRTILLWGTVTAGAGLIVVGLSDWAPVLALGPVATVVAMLGGITVVGLAHGCINAPVVTYVATSRAAQLTGEVEVSAFYRFVERVGHIGGPLILGQLLVLSGQKPVAIAWVGIATLVLGGLFAASLYLGADGARLGREGAAP